MGNDKKCREFSQHESYLLQPVWQFSVLSNVRSLSLLCDVFFLQVPVINIFDQPAGLLNIFLLQSI